MKSVKYFLIKFLSFFKSALKKLIIFLGIIFFILLILSLTDIPYYAYHHLGTANTIEIKKPQLIILMMGNNFPSPDALIRCYYAAQTAKDNPHSKIIIAYPYNENGSLKEIKLIKNEFIQRGIDSSRVFIESKGFNTYSQASNISNKFKGNLPVCIITSPEHMYRAIGTFRKTGFKYVTGLATFDNPLSENSITDSSNTKDIRIKSVTLRYNIWSYLNYELIVLREYCAIVYYKVKGWL